MRSIFLAGTGSLTPTKERIDEAIALFQAGCLTRTPLLPGPGQILPGPMISPPGYGADYATAHPLALEAARRAVEVDPMDAAAHAVLGIQIAYDGDFARAKAELDTALRLNPGSANILATYAGWSSTLGDPERGAELADQAIRLNPNYPTAMTGSFVFAYFMAGRYEDALRIIDKQPVESRTRNHAGRYGLQVMPLSVNGRRRKQRQEKR